MPTKRLKTVWNWIVKNSDPLDLRADKFISEVFQKNGLKETTLTRSYLHKQFTLGLVKLNEAPILKRNLKFKIGDKIELEFPEPTVLNVDPIELPIEILFEDEHFVIINKHPGMSVHPSSTDKSPTVVNALLFHIKNLSGIGGVLRPGIVHRLDKWTSGTLLITKNDKAHLLISDLFKKHSIVREYHALCFGVPLFKKKTVKTLIGRSRSHRKKMSTRVRIGRNAVSHFEVLEVFSKSVSLIQAKLETGRTHQVRVHLNDLRHSVIGDPVYGIPSESQKKWKDLPDFLKPIAIPPCGQFLHSRKLEFIHPITGENIKVVAPYTNAMASVIEKLRDLEKHL